MLKDKHGKSLTPLEIIQKVLYRFYSYGADFGLMIIRCTGYIPFHHYRRCIYRLAGMKIGKGTSIHMFANFFSLRNITIGQDTVIGNRIFMDGRDRLIIGSHVDIASEVMIYNSHHDIDSDDFGAVTGPVKIEDYVFIGPRVIILPGVTIGKGAVVGAGAVVSKDVPKLTVVGGVPAKEIRKRKVDTLNYRIGRARWFQ